MDHEISTMAKSIRQELALLPAASTSYSIFRVPRILRDLNEKAYTPQMVSIGPLHHGKPELMAMEQHKMRYLKDLLKRIRLDLETYATMIKHREEIIRNCYAEMPDLSSSKFVKMVLVDSAFIIESILRNSSHEVEYGFSAYVQKDMVLIENQLPFFVLEEIFNKFTELLPIHYSFVQLSITYFSNFLLVKDIIPQSIDSLDVKHFVDLLRKIHLPSSHRASNQNCSEKYVQVKSATALHEAGIKFIAPLVQSSYDIHYENGVLEFPQFIIQDSSQPVLRNIIAMEHYLYPQHCYILDCIVFMDGLIDTPRDVDILVKNGILQNWLGDSSAVANMFNKLTGEIFLANQHYYFYKLSNDLNSYCEMRRHKWKATLQRDYFSSPWRIVSTIAAFIFLLLAFVQTLCAVISL